MKLKEEKIAFNYVCNEAILAFLWVWLGSSLINVEVVSYISGTFICCLRFMIWKEHDP